MLPNRVIPMIVVNGVLGGDAALSRPVVSMFHEAYTGEKEDGS